MKEYGDLLRDDPAYAGAGGGASPRKVRDVAELLVELGPGRRPASAADDRRLPRRLPPRRTRRASASQPRALLRGIPGLELREIADAGDLLRLGRHLQPAATRSRPRELGDRKARAVLGHRRRRSGHRQPRLPDAGRRGARRQGERMPLAHTVQVLDASIRGRRHAARAG